MERVFVFVILVISTFSMSALAQTDLIIGADVIRNNGIMLDHLDQIVQKIDMQGRRMSIKERLQLAYEMGVYAGAQAAVRADRSQNFQSQQQNIFSEDGQLMALRQPKLARSCCRITNQYGDENVDLWVDGVNTNHWHTARGWESGASNSQKALNEALAHGCDKDQVEYGEGHNRATSDGICSNR